MGYKILLAEDHPVNAKLAATIMSKLGHKIITASNGVQVIDILKKEDFDFILMDIEMPELSGIDAAKMIKEGKAGTLKANIPVIFMTAYDLSEIENIDTSFTIEYYIRKPISANTITNVIKKIFGE